jgi:uncharacterized protein DUF4403
MRPHTTLKRLVSFRLALFLLAASACEPSLDVSAPPPAMMADTDTLSALPSSTLDIPLTYDLTPVVRALENAVDKKFGDINERHAIPGHSRVQVAFEGVRDPFQVSLDGQTARLTTVIHYKGRGWYDAPLVPEVSTSCGLGAVQPRARIEIAAPLRITPDWHLRARTRIEKVGAASTEARDQCKVTVFKVDVTPRVTDAARKVLEGKRALVDERIAALNIRPRFEEWWHLLQQPLRLTDSVWLVINPTAVRMGQTVGVRRMLVTALGFSASPRIVTGVRPQPVVTPLPKLYPAAVGSGLHILIEGFIDYDLATRLLEKEIVGKKVTKAGKTIEVRSVRLFGIGGGRVALELRFRGAANGLVYFVGTPRYDPTTNHLYVPDLEYDVGSANLLVSGFDWLKHGDVRDEIRSRARWPVGGIVKEGRDQLEKGLNRELAPGVNLVAVVDSVRGIAVHARRTNIRMQAQADANARLTVKQGT